MKTRETIEAQESHSSATEAKKYGRGENPRSLANLRMFQPGQSGNPAGKPKRDMSQVIARQLFENNPELIYAAYGELLKKGSAFGFQVLAERAYGKLKETRDTGSEFNEIPDNQLQAEIDRIMSRLSKLARGADAAAEAGVATARAEKPNGAAQDPQLLPGNGAVKA